LILKFGRETVQKTGILMVLVFESPSAVLEMNNAVLQALNSGC